MKIAPMGKGPSPLELNLPAAAGAELGATDGKAGDLPIRTVGYLLEQHGPEAVGARRLVVLLVIRLVCGRVLVQARAPISGGGSGGQLWDELAHQIGHGPAEFVMPMIALHGNKDQAAVASVRQCHRLSFRSSAGQLITDLLLLIHGASAKASPKVDANSLA
jgi:hypothetical protein